MQFLGFLAPVLGYVMEFLYNLVQNYGIALIIFTILARLLMFPLTLSQQKNTAKTAAFQPMMQEIQKKWANDKNRQNEEMMKFQEENGIKMTAGCGGMIANFVVLFSVIEVIYRPLRYILHVDQGLIDSAAELLGLSTNAYTVQSSIIGAVMEGNQSVINLMGGDVVEKITNFNFNFLGLNMAQIPTFSLEAWPYLILPVLSILTMFLSQIVIMKTGGSQASGQGKTMLIMTIVMGVWFGYYAFTVPVAFSLYYATSNLLMLVQQLIVKRIYNPEEMKRKLLEEYEERKKAKKAKKVVKVKDEKGEVVTKEVSDADLAKIRLARARELDAERYGNTEAEIKQSQNVIEKANKIDEDKYEKNNKKTEIKEAENTEKKPDENTDAMVAEASEEADGIEKAAVKEQPEEPKQEYKPGRRKRARQKKEEAGFAQQEKAAEEKKNI